MTPLARAMPVNAGMLDLQVQPSIAAGRRRVRFAAVVTNTGPTSVEATLSVGGGDGEIVAAIVPARLLLDPGQTRAVDVMLRPRRPRLAGEELSRTLSIRARGDNTDAPAVRDVVFVQQRLVPVWALALGVRARRRRGRRGHAAARPRHGADRDGRARRGHGRAHAEVRRPAARPARCARAPSADVAPGTILDQIPAAGSARRARRPRHAARRDRLARRAITPALSGQTPARAAALLQAAGLTVGPLLPAGATRARRRRQPAARRGHARARGNRRDAHRPRRDGGRGGQRRRAGGAERPRGGAVVRRPDRERLPARGRRWRASCRRSSRTISPEPLGTILERQPAPGPGARRRRQACA